MTVNWGVNGSAPVKAMGDDLWLLECPSKEDASRILRLDRFYFGSSKIRLDIWLPGSGRSEVLRKQGLAWITASGIPLHLLSQDLYKQIGDRCGGFIEANTSLCPLGSVRLKISCARDVPRSVSLRFLDEFYSIPIVLENGGFGALVEKEVQRTVPEVPKVKSSCKVSQGIPRRWRLVPGQSSKGGEIPEEVVIETAPESGSQVGRFKVDGGVSEVLGLSRVAGELTPSSMEEGSTEGTGKVERGKARESRCDSLSTDGSVLYPAVFERQDIISIGQPPFSDLRLNSNAGMSVMARKFPPTQTDILEGFFVPLGLGPRNHALFFKLMLQPCSISLGLGSLGQLSSFWSKPTEVIERNFPFHQSGPSDFTNISYGSGELSNYEETSNMAVLAGDGCHVSDVGVTDESEQATTHGRSEEVGRVLEAVIEAANLFGLQMEGSRERAVDFAIETAKDVCKRRSSAKGRSRTEMELRRLGSSLEVVKHSSRRRTTPGYVSSIPYSDVA
ncbi:hypothetical protein LINGRAHAP2_LOCUS9575 [Linum grandiflorum]